jgi:hypothetical protein
MSKLVTQTKAVEFNIYKTAIIVGLEFDWTLRQDHAGIRAELSLLGRTVELNWYDTRHWNSAANRWEVYDYE